MQIKITHEITDDVTKRILGFTTMPERLVRNKFLKENQLYVPINKLPADFFTHYYDYVIEDGGVVLRPNF